MNYAPSPVAALSASLIYQYGIPRVFGIISSSPYAIGTIYFVVSKKFNVVLLRVTKKATNAHLLL